MISRGLRDWGLLVALLIAPVEFYAGWIMGAYFERHRPHEHEEIKTPKPVEELPESEKGIEVRGRTVGTSNYFAVTNAQANRTGGNAEGR